VSIGYHRRLAWLAALANLAARGFAAEISLKPAHTQAPPQLAGQAPIGRLAAETPLSVTVVLPLRNPDAVDRLIAEQGDPSSPQFLRYLTPREFGARFGPSPAEYASVLNYLVISGLKVTRTSAARSSITATGAAAQLEQAFSVHLNRYRLRGREVFANDRTPAIPAGVSANGLVSVQGLTNALVYQPRDNGTPPFTPTAINRLYNYQGLRNAGVDGTGQKIAIYSLADYSSSNLTNYAAHVNQFAFPPSSAALNAANVTRVAVDGGTTQHSEEADLDAELTLGSAPGAQIQVWLGANSSNAVFDIYDRFANQTDVKIMTSSWGIGEDQLAPADFDAYHQVFQQAAAEGLTIFNSSGDNGSNEAQDGTVAVSHPASDPYVVAVGGTNLFAATGDAYDHETGWGGTVSGKITGSGGGLSLYFPRPAWQTGPGVQNGSSNGKRQLPDVSMDASPSTGYVVYLTVNTTTAWFYGGGTSAAAPEWAAGLLLIQQSLGKPFFLSPLLYQVFSKVKGGAPFHDVTVGNNGLFSCTSGWDYVTGIGSANFTGLRSALGPLVIGAAAGDVNRDGKVDAQDIAAVLRVAGGLTPDSADILTLGDLDYDGLITVRDAAAIARVANGLG
jgi:kumamolisin